MDASVLLSFMDELSKIAVRVPFIHGTSGRWPVLQPGIGSTILKNDPNPRAVYTAVPSRRTLERVRDFAHSAQDARGGEAVVAAGKMDTADGWMPSTLSDWGRRNIGSVEKLQDLVLSLDDIADKKARGKVWEQVQRGSGRWNNELNGGATLRPIKYVPA